ncbi:pescadillo homolog [Xenia sp. Carnegie-2017]|uniref:pescadillo homolog n=1 Tax=Xenia sp. Carnegie-2017 TaxID=2897299 RepID=UPI001F0385A1|nr:pescadillo homolog [Xenia sp. Carnegie-2017]
MATTIIFRKVLNKAELTEIVLSYWNYITDFNEQNIEEEYQDMEKETEIEEINEEKADEFKQDIDEEEIQDEDMDYEHNTEKYLKEEGNEEDEMGPEEHFMMQEKTESTDLNIKDMYEKIE